MPRSMLPLMFRRPGASPVTARTPVLGIDEDARRLTHMAASLLLDYPGDGFADRAAAVGAALGSLPETIAAEFREFLAHVEATDAARLEADYVATFDLKRRCCLYLTYFQTGDTRRRGQALVAFLAAYRDAGWEFDADELPDFLPAVLEFSARSASPIAAQLIGAHRDGIEVLREALEQQQSPWAAPVRAVCRSLPELDAATRERFLALANDGPPAETVGLAFPGAATGDMPPFSPVGATASEARA